MTQTEADVLTAITAVCPEQVGVKSACTAWHH